MKLIMENWRQYLSEEELRNEVIAYVAEHNIALSEQQILEIDWKKALKKYGSRAAMMAAIGSAGIGAGDAQAQSFEDIMSDKMAMSADDAGAIGDVAMSKQLGPELATVVFRAVKDQLQTGDEIDIGVQVLPVTELDQGVFGKGYINTLTRLLSNQGVKVINTSYNAIEDKAVQRGTLNLHVDAQDVSKAVSGNLEDGYDLLVTGKHLLNKELRGTYIPAKSINEGALGKLAGTATLGMALGAGTPAQAGDTDTYTSSDTSTTQQADVKVQTNTLVKNDDGSVSVTVPIGPMTQMLDNPMFASNFKLASQNIARGALAMAVKGQAVKAGVKVVKGDLIGSSYTYLDKDGNETVPTKKGAPVYITITGFVK